MRNASGAEPLGVRRLFFGSAPSPLGGVTHPTNNLERCDKEAVSAAVAVEAGAPEDNVNVTEAMKEAGGKVIADSIFFSGVLSSAEHIASEVYRAMEVVKNGSHQ